MAGPLPHDAYRLPTGRMRPRREEWAFVSIGIAIETLMISPLARERISKCIVRKRAVDSAFT